MVSNKVLLVVVVLLQYLTVFGFILETRPEILTFYVLVDRYVYST